jgi:hypothetical protein
VTGGGHAEGEDVTATQGDFQARFFVECVFGPLLLLACGPRAELCNGTPCTANAVCVESTEGEACRCVPGFVERSERCQPEGPCGKLATELCRAVGGDEGACAALHEGVATADGAACEQALAEGDMQQAVDWMGLVQPMLARGVPAAYRTFLTRSLLDPCGAATELLCTVMRPGERGCGADAAALTRDDQSCRAVLRGYDNATMSGAPEGGVDAGTTSDALTENGEVLVHLIPDPANRGQLPPQVFRAALLEKRNEIDACYDGALGSFPGLAGRAVFIVHIDATGLVTVELGRADGPITGSGVAQCVLNLLLMLDFSASPPTDGPFDVHVSFDFGS